MYSLRFGRVVALTRHARERMLERGVDDLTLLDVVETGRLKKVDERRLFVFKRIAGRRDNLVCAVAVEETQLVIKTVMVNWTLRE